MTFRLRENTLEALKDIEQRQPKELKRHPSERVRLVVETYVEKTKRRNRRTAGAR